MCEELSGMFDLEADLPARESSFMMLEKRSEPSLLDDMKAAAQELEDQEASQHAKDPDLGNKAVAVAYLHHLMCNGRPGNLIIRFLDSQFAGALYKQRQSQIKLNLGVVAFVVIVLVAPWVYGVTLMKDPCVLKDVRIDGERQHLAEVHCHVEQFMKSWWALTLAPAAFVVVLFFRATGPFWVWLGARRAFRKAKMSAYAWVRRDAPKLWYQPFSVEGRALALCWTVGMWSILTMEFLAISVLLKDGVALIVGYTLGKALLIMANVILSPTDERIAIISAELAKTANENLGDTMKRLFEHDSRCFYLSSLELDTIHKLPHLREDIERHEMSWFGLREIDKKFRFRTPITVGELESPIQSIYLSDLDIVVPVQEFENTAVYSDSSSSSSSTS